MLGEGLGGVKLMLVGVRESFPASMAFSLLPFLSYCSWLRKRHIFPMRSPSWPLAAPEREVGAVWAGQAPSPLSDVAGPHVLPS